MGNEQSSTERRTGRVRSRSQPRSGESGASSAEGARCATTPVTPSVSNKRLKDIDSPSLDLSTASSPCPTPMATPKKLLTRQKRASSAASNVDAAESGNADDQTSTDTFASTLRLSAYQLQALAHSWPRVQWTGGHIVGAKFFKQLCQKNAQAKEIFQKATIIEGFAAARTSSTGGRCADVYKEHGRLLFELFNEGVKSLNEPPDELIRYCRKIGSRHTTLKNEGFNGAIWDDLAELLVDHITKLDAVRRHRELSKAWTAFIMFLVERVKDGYALTGGRRSSTPSVGVLKSTGTNDSLTTRSAEEENV